MRRPRRPVSVREIALCAFFAFGIVWSLHLIWNIFGEEERARRDVNDTRAELASLEARQAALSGDLDFLNTPRGQEAAFRDTRGVARPGEDVIIVVPQAAATTSTTTRPWWRKVLDWF